MGDAAIAELVAAVSAEVPAGCAEDRLGDSAAARVAAATQLKQLLAGEGAELGSLSRPAAVVEFIAAEGPAAVHRALHCMGPAWMHECRAGLPRVLEDILRLPEVAAAAAQVELATQRRAGAAAAQARARRGLEVAGDAAALAAAGTAAPGGVWWCAPPPGAAVGPDGRTALAPSWAPPPRRGERLPVIILTGWLGAGKTTVLNAALRQLRGRWAVVENEVGEVPVDGALVDAAAAPCVVEEVTLGGGCVCHSAKGGLARALQTFSGKSPPLDGVVVEATGVADPGAVAQAVLSSGCAVALRRVVCVADAKQLAGLVSGGGSDAEAAKRQLAFADLVVLSKLDCATPAEAAAARDAVTAHAPRGVRVLGGERGAVDPAELLGPAADHSAAAPDRGPLSAAAAAFCAQLRSAGAEAAAAALVGCLGRGAAGELAAALRSASGGHAHHGHSHARPRGGHRECAEGAVALESHADSGRAGRAGGFVRTAEAHGGLSSVGVREGGVADPSRFTAWLQQQVGGGAVGGGQVLRCKGVVAVAGREERYVFHGVGGVFDGWFAERWRSGEERGCTVVFIGRGLDRGALLNGLRGCISPPLRFRPGDRVVVPTAQGLSEGVVARQWDRGLPYSVRLGCGRVVWAPCDTDDYVAPSARGSVAAE